MTPYVLACALAVSIFAPLSAGAQERDLSGVWLVKEPGATFSRTPPPEMTAWAQTRFKAHRATIGPTATLDANDPTVACFPAGVPYVLMVPTPFEFVQTGDRVLQLFEYNHNVRRIYTDGRAHPPDLQDTESAQWMGHSTGRWQEDTFVIDTIGFNDRSWLDRAGHPHSSALHLVERLRRVDHATLEYTVTVDDSQAYAGPWTGQMMFALRPDWEVLEHHCIPEGEEYRSYRERAWK